MTEYLSRPNLLCSVVLMLFCGAACCGQEEAQPGTTASAGGGSAYREAEQLFREKQYDQALQVCILAIDDILPDRIYNRYQALAVRCCLQLNRRAEALRRVELIWQRDRMSPHLSLVPLVWDDRLPEEERSPAPANELVSSSVVRQLAAASSLLQKPEHQDRCIKVLAAIRGDRQPPLTVLAEAQLWRVKAIQTEEIPLLVVQRWQKRAATFPQELRAGPQFVVGRAFQLRHKPDIAVLELLWAPLMAADDPVLAASGLAEAIRCLEASGRGESARRLRLELQQRYSNTSAARQIRNSTTPRSAAPAQADRLVEETDREN